MIRIASVALCLGLALSLTAVSFGDEPKKDTKKEGAVKTLKGTITCAKCDLKVAKECATVIKVKDGDKEVVYYFDAATHKKEHGKTCQEPKEGTVTGTVTKDGDKMVVKCTKVEYKD